MSKKRDKSSPVPTELHDFTPAQRKELQRVRFDQAEREWQREQQLQRQDKAIPTVRKSSRDLPGAEPWEWRPPRYEGECDAAGDPIPTQPPPPTGVKSDRRTGKGMARALGFAVNERAIAEVLERAEAAGVPRNQVDALGMQIAGFSRAEIAKQLGVTENQAKWLLERGRRSLRGDADADEA